MGERAVALCADGEQYWQYDAGWAGAAGVVDAVDAAGWAALDRVLTGDWTSHGPVALSPWAEGCDYLDTEAVYLVGPAGVRVGLPVWFGVPAGNCGVPPWVGAVVWSWQGGVARRRERIAWLKGALGRAVDAGVLSQGGAVACVWSSLAGEAHQVSPATAAYVQGLLGGR